MSDFKHAPLPRHPALAPLSRDHYLGLVQAQHLLKASAQNSVARRKAVAEFLDAWQQEIKPHFDAEERLLSDCLDAGDRRMLLDEHAAIVELAARFPALRKQVEPAADRLAQLGNMLEKHIRWEERVLFPRLQKQLKPEQLEILGQQTAALETRRPRSPERKKS